MTRSIRSRLRVTVTLGVTAVAVLGSTPTGARADAEACATYSECTDLARTQVQQYRAAAEGGVTADNAADLSARLNDLQATVKQLEVRLPEALCAGDCAPLGTGALTAATTELFALLPAPCGTDSCDVAGQTAISAVRDAVEAMAYRVSVVARSACGGRCDAQQSASAAVLPEIATAAAFGTIDPVQCRNIANGVLLVLGVCYPVEDPANYIFFSETVVSGLVEKVMVDGEDLSDVTNAIGSSQVSTGSRTAVTVLPNERVVVGGGGRVIESSTADPQLMTGGSQQARQCVYSTGQKGFYAYSPAYATQDLKSQGVYAIYHVYKLSHARKRTVAGATINVKQFETCSIVSGAGRGGNKIWRVFTTESIDRRDPVWIGKSWGTSGAPNNTAAATLGFQIADPRIPVSISASVPVGNEYTYTGQQGPYEPASDAMPEKYDDNQFTAVWRSPHTFRWQGSSNGQGNVVHGLYELPQTSDNPNLVGAAGGASFCSHPYGIGCD